jgi:extracellular factor (EF) 3-hydroxypalmitic acid methyl ester biosynthesis protein
MINTVFLNNAVSQAHRNRIDILQKKLTGLATSEPEQKIKVLNVACGPALEVQRFLKSSPDANKYEFTLLDFSDVTLNYTKQQLDSIIRERKLTTKITYVQESHWRLAAARRVALRILG